MRAFFSRPQSSAQSKVGPEGPGVSGSSTPCVGDDRHATRIGSKEKDLFASPQDSFYRPPPQSSPQSTPRINGKGLDVSTKGSARSNAHGLHTSASSSQQVPHVVMKPPDSFASTSISRRRSQTLRGDKAPASASSSEPKTSRIRSRFSSFVRKPAAQNADVSNQHMYPSSAVADSKSRRLQVSRNEEADRQPSPQLFVVGQTDSEARAMEDAISPATRNLRAKQEAPYQSLSSGSNTRPQGSAEDAAYLSKGPVQSTNGTLSPSPLGSSTSKRKQGGYFSHNAHTDSSTSKLTTPTSPASTTMLHNPIADQNARNEILYRGTRSSAGFSLRRVASRLNGYLSPGKENSTAISPVSESGTDVSIADRSTAQPAYEAGHHLGARSQSLADELNELGVAFGEGLLGDEEYRILRQGVFDRMMSQGAMEVPKEATLRGPQQATRNEQPQVDSSEASTVMSTLPTLRSSKSNLASIFSSSKSKRESLAAESSRLYPPPSNNSRTSTSSVRRRSSAASRQALEEQYLQARRARTIGQGGERNGYDLGSTRSTLAVGLTSPDERPQSLASASIRSARSVGRLSISNGNALLGGDYADKKSEEIAAEIAVVEAEGHRLLANFKTLEASAVSRHQALGFDQIRKAVAGLNIDKQTIDMADDFVVVHSEDVCDMPDNAIRSAKNGTGKEGPLLRRSGSIGSPFSFKKIGAQGMGNGSLLALPVSSPSLNSSLSSHRNDQNSATATNGSKYLAPSAYNLRRRSSYLAASRSNTDTSVESTPTEAGAIDEDAGVAQLRRELIEIHKRRAEVARKYVDRVAFLRSAQRSARIREGLR